MHFAVENSEPNAMWFSSNISTKNMTFKIDSGTMHNFIAEDHADELPLLLSLSSNYEVVLDNSAEQMNFQQGHLVFVLFKKRNRLTLNSKQFKWCNITFCNDWTAQISSSE